MNFDVSSEIVSDLNFPSGDYYARVSSPGLTTHRLGIPGARAAALDLVQLWRAEEKTGDHQTALKENL